ncbi:hypothetical protein [Leucobacter celer]|uniref:hypothetical protein n=1 Tax=Leucobacter celer TaxID=668625 RepID=UPI001F4D268E|nr:hypothetical protein [Leucobacter celer]
MRNRDLNEHGEVLALREAHEVGDPTVDAAMVRGDEVGGSRPGFADVVSCSICELAADSVRSRIAVIGPSAGLSVPSIR